MALVFITGGARSGKSSAAERLALRRAEAGTDVVVVVFGDGEGDSEMAARIERHRRERPEAFSTLEAADGHSWMSEVSAGSLVVVDCLGTLLARVMAAHVDADADAGAADDPIVLEAALDEAMRDVVSWLARRDGDAIVVSNEVGSGVVPAYASGRVFRDVLGRANALLTTAADASYLAVAGRLFDLGALPRDIVWPGE